MGDEHAHLGHILGMNGNTTAPMRAARHRLHRQAAHLDPAIGITLPTPVIGGADGDHDSVGEDIGQRLAEDAHQGKGEAVHPHIIVFPMRAGSLQAAIALGGAAFGGELAATIDAVGLVEQRALPFGGIGEQMPPGDGGILPAVKAPIIDEFAHRPVDIGNKPIGHGDAGQDGEIAFGHREGLVDLQAIADLPDALAMLVDHRIGRPARRHGAKQRVEGRRLEEATFQMGAQVAGPGGLMRGDEGQRVLQIRHAGRLEQLASR